MKKTVLFDSHLALGAKMIDFNGFQMPLSYSSIIKEHGSVRSSCGVFDVSHMGRIWVKDGDARKFLQYICTNDLKRLVKNKVMYTPFCYENGATVDDMLVYMLSDNKYLLVVNASNIQKDLEWFNKNNKFNTFIENVSDRYSQLAIQGPNCASLIKKVFNDIDLPDFFSFISSKGYLISRTGYTGEDGFEIYMKNKEAVLLWDKFLDQGREFQISPIGLGARDTLRFEACLSLYGHELSPTITPLEAGLNSFVKLDKADDFIGKKALAENKQFRILIGLEMTERGIARQGHTVLSNENTAGIVTSGSFSPTLNKNLALALIDKQYSEKSDFYVLIRNKKVKAKRVDIPFYKKKYNKTGGSK